MIEKIIFNVLAIALFTITFLKLIRKNDTSYIYMLAIEFVGIAINFVELFIASSFGFCIKLLMYLLSVILPIAIFIIERVKKISLSELAQMIIIPILEKTNNIDKAKNILNNYITKNPQSYISHKLLAQIYEKEENYEASISEYLKVTELNRNDLNSYYNLAVMLNKNKQNDKAIIVLQEILKQTPENEKIVNFLGDIYFEKEMYKEMVLLYMTSLRYHPGSFDIYYSIGMAYTMLNDFSKAKDFYEKAAEINSLAYNAKLNLGQIALMYGDLDEAENYFRSSLKQEDLEAGSYYYLSEIALLKGDEERAKNYMNVAVELDPRSYKQMQKDPVFMPIKEKIMPPAEDIKQAKEEILNQKEKTVDKHLTKMCILVENLNINELNSKEKDNQKQKDIDQKQKE